MISKNIKRRFTHTFLCWRCPGDIFSFPFLLSFTFFVAAFSFLKLAVSLHAKHSLSEEAQMPLSSWTSVGKFAYLIEPHTIYVYLTHAVARDDALI